ncbi:MAG: leucine-rich repeat domain-containing protein [Treponema sp.]|nr:leucine-rich repeat domain-containing protein [Treponema sp.]
MKIAGFGKVAAVLAVVLVSVALLSCGKGKKADKTKVSAQDTKDGEKEEVVEIQIVDTKDANAASDFIYETTVDGSAVVIQKYIGSRGNVIVPEEIEGYKVTTIGESSFSGVKNIASVVLPSSVTTIRASAFNGSSLKEVTLPSSVTTIRASAFNGSSLKEVTLPSSVTTIEASAFKDTYLTSVKLPQGLTSVSKSCFSGTRLTSVELHEGITSVGDYAFSSCNITNFNIPASLKNVGYHAFAGNPLKDVEIASRDTAVVYGNGAFASCNSWGNMTVALRKKLNESGYKGNYYEKDISCCKNAK